MASKSVAYHKYLLISAGKFNVPYCSSTSFEILEQWDCRILCVFCQYQKKEAYIDSIILYLIFCYAVRSEEESTWSRKPFLDFF